MRHAALLVVVLVLLVPAAPLAASPSAAAVGSPSSTAQASPSVAQTAFDTNVTIDVYVDSSGDARFNVSTAYRLNSSAEREAFDRVAENFSDGRVGFQADDFREAAEAAADVTGRSMEIDGVNRVDDVREAGENASWNATGVLALEFTWTEFARVSGNRILLGDVFASGWLPGLEPDMRLRIHTPPGYGVYDASIRPSGGSLVWHGPHSFEDGGPRVVFEGGLDPTSTGTGTTEGGPGDVAGQFRMVLAGLAVLLVGGLLAYVWTQRTPGTGVGESDDEGPGDGSGPAIGTTAAGPDGGQSADEGATAERDDQQPDADGESDGPAGGDARSDDDGEEAGEGGDAEIDEELLSDEERVERMLQENGGRMKQANIVTETGWSNAKVSQLLSGMDDEERIEKLRLGRENLIILPDEDDEDLV